MIATTTTDTPAIPSLERELATLKGEAANARFLKVKLDSAEKSLKLREAALSDTAAREKVLRRALESAISTIEVWHADPVAWELYKANAPEMKLLTAALKFTP